MNQYDIKGFQLIADAGQFSLNILCRNSVTVGLVANPASARDIRRLVADASAVTTNDKLNLIRRAMVGLAAAGVDRVVSMTDLSGLSGGLAALAAGRAGKKWPALQFVQQEITQTVLDTTTAVRAMVAEPVDLILVLGGDGTNRAVAKECGDIPLLPISTGTNNAFPKPVEPTVAGIAAGLFATGQLHAEETVRRSKCLVVNHRGNRELALVDVAVTTQDNVGAGAVYDTDCLRELFLCFAEPSAIGLSAIGGHAHPITREEPRGLRLRFGTPELASVLAPIAPGLVARVGLAEIEVLELGERRRVREEAGVIAIDGERMTPFTADHPVEVTLDSAGPLVLDVERCMTSAAQRGLLRRAGMD